MLKLLAFIGGLTVTFLLVCYRGLMLSTMWAWFVMTTFDEAPPLGIAASIGLSLLIVSFTGAGKSAEDEDTTWGMRFIRSLVSITVLFGFGWIVKQFL